MTWDPAFSRRTGGAGFIGMCWPRRYGGDERSELERFVVQEEMLAAGAPCFAHWIADRQSGQQIPTFGSDAAKERFLPEIVRGECYSGIGIISCRRRDGERLDVGDRPPDRARMHPRTNNADKIVSNEVGRKSERLRPMPQGGYPIIRSNNNRLMKSCLWTHRQR